MEFNFSSFSSLYGGAALKAIGNLYEQVDDRENFSEKQMTKWDIRKSKGISYLDRITDVLSNLFGNHDRALQYFRYIPIHYYLIYSKKEYRRIMIICRNEKEGDEASKIFGIVLSDFFHRMNIAHVIKKILKEPFCSLITIYVVRGDVKGKLYRIEMESSRYRIVQVDFNDVPDYFRKLFSNVTFRHVHGIKVAHIRYVCGCKIYRGYGPDWKFEESKIFAEFNIYYNRFKYLEKENDRSIIEQDVKGE